MIIFSVIGLVAIALCYLLFSEEAREQRKLAKAIRDGQARRAALTDDERRKEQAELDRQAWRFM